MFRYSELEYFRFGLQLGFSNLLGNGFSLGLKKSIGKITQPINSYTRFPEYHFMATAIHAEIGLRSPENLKILDVGSPKCFGLYLAYKFPVEVYLTDISPSNIDEYTKMWKPLESTAEGSVKFMQVDARHLGYVDESFDVVYSMSVIEHIGGSDGDSQGIHEMIRVLRPNGLLVLSVPYGNHFAEQYVQERKATRNNGSHSNGVFFQRIYNKASLENRILAPVLEFGNPVITTVWREFSPVASVWGGCGEVLRGILGWLNPFLSVLVNRSRTGIVEQTPSYYGDVHLARDIYGDAMVFARKRCISARTRDLS